MENQRFREIASQKSMQVQFVEPDMKYTFGNHNRLLTAYEGCIGVKTGFTKKSGRAWFLRRAGWRPACGGDAQCAR